MNQWYSQLLVGLNNGCSILYHFDVDSFQFVFDDVLSWNSFLQLEDYAIDRRRSIEGVLLYLTVIFHRLFLS